MPSRVHQVCPHLCQTKMDNIGITTAKAGKVIILMGDRYVIKEGFPIPHNFLTILDSYSTWQALAQTSLSSLQEYDRSNKNITIQQFDHIKTAAEKTGMDPLEVRIIKLKGLALGDINEICKEGSLTWYSFRQRLFEHYSNVPYECNAMFACSHLSQGGEEPTAQYLVRAKFLLECIHHTTKLSSIPGAVWDNMYLVRGLKAPHIRKRLVNEQDSWRMMQDVFNSIICITRMEERIKIFLEPNFELVSQVSEEWVHEVSTGKYTGQKPSSKTYNGPQLRLQTNFYFRSSSRQYNIQLKRDQESYQPNQGQRKLVCYYCKGEHHIRDCEKFTKDRSKYKLKTADHAKKYKDKFRQAARKGNIMVNEALI